ncbi:MAG: dTMP kinase [Pseudomonadota bacterium]|nr:dTMP kinase [Pseudomonadota bacterium]
MPGGPTGLFISLEGGEGAGKSTQVQRLATALSGTGREIVLTREPGGTPAAEAMRTLLLAPETDLDAMEQVLLLYAARHNHVRTLIAPALARGAVVICDRFADSTRAYQGAAGGIAGARIAALHHLVLGDLEPDLTLLLDLPVEAGLARARVRGGAVDRFEGAGLAFHARLRQGFLDLADHAPGRIRVIDATRDPDSVAADVLTAVREKLG